MIDSIIPENTINRERLEKHSLEVPDYVIKSYENDGRVINFYKNGNGKYNISQKKDGSYISIDQYLKKHFKIDKLRPINQLERDLAA